MYRVTFAVIAGLASLAAAQSTGPLPPLTAQVEVRVVNVDVSVTDKNAAPVGGLTKDDFEILEDGKLQKITNFAVINGTESAPKSVSPTDTRRRMLLIIDNNYLSIRDRNRALDTVEKYLDTSFSGEWAVAAVGHSVDMLQSFTSDKARVHAALAKARKMGSFEEQAKIDRGVLSERYTRTEDVQLPENYQRKVEFSAQEQSYRNLLTVQNTARAVVDTARAYAAEDGKKFILLLTGGMEINTTFKAFNDDTDSNGRELQQIQLRTAEICDAMVREANAANFTVHVVNARAREMMAPQHDVTNRSSGINSANLLRDFDPSPIDVSDRDSIPLSIALGTGGMYLPSNDLAESMKRVDMVTSNFYSLGYSPGHNGDRQYHTIKVRVKRSGVRVANRVGYFDQTPDDRLEDMLRARMEFEPGTTTLPVHVEVGNASPAEHDLILPVTAEMPLARITVIPRDQNLVGRVHVYCSVFDENGRNVGFSHQTQEVSMPLDVQRSGGDFRYTIRVHLQKGAAFTIVITLRDELSNEIGSTTRAVRL